MQSGERRFRRSKTTPRSWRRRVRCAGRIRTVHDQPVPVRGCRPASRSARMRPALSRLMRYTILKLSSRRECGGTIFLMTADIVGDEVFRFMCSSGWTPGAEPVSSVVMRRRARDRSSVDVEDVARMPPWIAVIRLRWRRRDDASTMSADFGSVRRRCIPWRRRPNRRAGRRSLPRLSGRRRRSVAGASVRRQPQVEAVRQP